MSRFTVNINEPEEPQQQEKPTVVKENVSFAPNEETPKKKRSRFARVLGVLGILLLAFLVIVGVGGYFYWQSVKRTPQYSLALLVDAARRDDNQQIQQLVDTEAVIDSFVPQITDKAVELYGRNLPPAQITRVKESAAPLMPAIKQRAKEELPRVIREKTQPFESFPWWTIALFAGRAVEIRTENDMAYIKSKIPEREIEVTMRRSGDLWKIIAIKDEPLARRIAEKIGQELIIASTKGNIKKAGEKLGVQNLQEMMKKVEDIFK
ncbi:MAG TPA: hypothetical protein VF604_05835 [Pyrinomonadaceae bacterium]|jgi:hypothetical protein